MNRLKSLLQGQPISFTTLGVVITLTLTFGLGWAILVMASTINDQNLSSLPICLTNTCTENFITKTAQAFAIAKATLDLGVAIATIGGIFVALLNYFNTSTNSALTNHIEHLKVFIQYVEAEIKKREKLSLPLIDILFLYSFIFKQSRNGKTTVSREYEDFVKKLNKIISESNERCVIGTPGGFSYKDHQRRVRDHLATAGISVHTAPRNDYFEMEDQLFSLLHRVSQSFCTPDTLPEITNRHYY